MYIHEPVKSTPVEKIIIDTSHVEQPVEVLITPTRSSQKPIVQEQTLGVNFHYFKQLETLEELRKSWEGNEMAASHARLYCILTDCYKYYLSMTSEKTKEEVRTHMRDSLNAFIKNRGFRTLADTHEMNQVVKAVFGEDRRRTSAYALALRVASKSAAGKQPIPADELATWIAKQGGIEEVRRAAKTQSSITADSKVEVASATLKGKVLMKFRPDTNTMPFDSSDSDKHILLVATYRPTGEVEINTVVKNDTAVRAALTAYYKNTKQERENSEKKAEISASNPLTFSASLVNQ